MARRFYLYVRDEICENQSLWVLFYFVSLSDGKHANIVICFLYTA